MKGKLIYQQADPEFINSISGWFIHANNDSYFVSENSVKKILSNKYGLKDGDEVEFEVDTNCSKIGRAHV